MSSLWPLGLCGGGYALTSLIVLLGAMLGSDAFRPGQAVPPHDPQAPRRPDLAERLARHSGEAYRHIAEVGYAYDPRRASSVALFPAYPLAGRGARHLLGVRTEVALLIVSHVCWGAALVALSTYARRRGEGSSTLAGFQLLAAALYPPGFYTRLPYSEAMFFLLVVLVLLGIHVRWPLGSLALIVGLATATRPVGVCLVLPLVLDIWRRSARPAAIAARLAVYVPLALWGLVAYMGFLWARFDAPLAFAQTQQHYHVREPAPLGQRALELASLTPVREVYDAEAPGHWARQRLTDVPIFNLLWANPLYFLGAIGLTVLGAARGWLNRFEWSAAAGLILMPYLLRGHEMSMAATGRFTVVVVPIYLVMGQLLQRIGLGPSAALLALSAMTMAAYAACFAAGYVLL